MHDDLAAGVDLERHMVVVTVEERLAVSLGAEELSENGRRGGDDPRPVGPCPPPRPGDVGKVGLPGVGRGVEGRKGAPRGERRAGEVPGGDRLPHPARPGMEHQPQAPLLVGLKLEEMIAAAE